MMLHCLMLGKVIAPGLAMHKKQIFAAAKKSCSLVLSDVHGVLATNDCKLWFICGTLLCQIRSAGIISIHGSAEEAPRLINGLKEAGAYKVLHKYIHWLAFVTRAASKFGGFGPPIRTASMLAARGLRQLLGPVPKLLPSPDHWCTSGSQPVWRMSD